MFSRVTNYAESAANEVVLNDIEPSDFLEFLTAIYPTHNAVTGKEIPSHRWVSSVRRSLVLEWIQ